MEALGQARLVPPDHGARASSWSRRGRRRPTSGPRSSPSGIPSSSRPTRRWPLRARCCACVRGPRSSGPSGPPDPASSRFAAHQSDPTASLSSSQSASRRPGRAPSRSSCGCMSSGSPSTSSSLRRRCRLASPGRPGWSRRAARLRTFMTKGLSNWTWRGRVLRCPSACSPTRREPPARADVRPTHGRAHGPRVGQPQPCPSVDGSRAAPRSWCCPGIGSSPIATG